MTPPPVVVADPDPCDSLLVRSWLTTGRGSAGYARNWDAPKELRRTTP